jgi:hypothetical protein
MFGNLVDGDTKNRKSTRNRFVLFNLFELLRALRLRVFQRVFATKMTRFDDIQLQHKKKCNRII